MPDADTAGMLGQRSHSRALSLSSCCSATKRRYNEALREEIRKDSELRHEFKKEIQELVRQEYERELAKRLSGQVRRREAAEKKAETALSKYSAHRRSIPQACNVAIPAHYAGDPGEDCRGAHCATSGSSRRTANWACPAGPRLLVHLVLILGKPLRKDDNVYYPRAVYKVGSPIFRRSP